MTAKRKVQISELLKGIETGDAAVTEVVNESKYIQHNPQTHEGSEGLAALFKRLSETSPRVNIVRVFADGDYVFAHTEYDFASSNIGFEIFRFEGDQAVEHWDNIQSRQGPNQSGHSMVDGPVDVTDLEKTEANRDLVKSFVRDVLIDHRFEEIGDYLDAQIFTQHHSQIADGLSALRSALEAGPGSSPLLEYERNHHVLAEGNFVLSVCEGIYNGKHSALFDLFRVSGSKLVEQWNTTESIPPRAEWKNDNGKF